jgi:Cu/Ag efflux pump CusA
MSEILVTLDAAAGLSRDEILAELREELTQVPGAGIAVEQPLQHVISQMLSGVKSQIGIKLYGDQLEVLRAKAEELKKAIEDVPGIKDLMVEQQIEVPQLRIDLKRRALAEYGLNAVTVNELIETAMNGRVVTELTQGDRKFDVLVRRGKKSCTPWQRSSWAA